MRILIALSFVLIAACGHTPPSRDLYACTNGINVLVTRDNNKSELRLSTGEVRIVKRATAIQGTRFASDQMHWFERGDEASLTRKGASAACRLINRNI